MFKKKKGNKPDERTPEQEAKLERITKVMQKVADKLNADAGVPDDMKEKVVEAAGTIQALCDCGKFIDIGKDFIKEARETVAEADRRGVSASAGTREEIEQLFNTAEAYAAAAKVIRDGVERMATAVMIKGADMDGKSDEDLATELEDEIRKAKLKNDLEKLGIDDHEVFTTGKVGEA